MRSISGGLAAATDNPDREAKLRYARRARIESLAALALTILVCVTVGLAQAGPASIRLIYAPGRIVPIPSSIPHQAGGMIDSRLVPDLRWLSSHFPIYVTEGYSGPLPDGSYAGCRRCHVNNSDHYNGLAVDIVPLRWSPRCDASWNGVTRLAKWAEPQQNQPIAPFRWVGYDGDAGHGCGNHLHLSWNHASAPPYTLADWVAVFPVGAPTDPPSKKTQPPPAKPKQPPRPTGGFEPSTPGGVSAGGG